MDLFSRKVVGWAMSDKIDSALATNALLMALTTRSTLRGLLHHSDQGCQFTGTTDPADAGRNWMSGQMNRNRRVL